MNLAFILESSAKDFPAKDAIVFGDTRLNFAQLNGAANQVANALIKNGIQKGDKVALSCLNIPYFPIVYYGILKAGAVVVPLSVLLKHNEVAYHLTDSDAKAFFCFEGNDALPMGKEGYDGFNQAKTCETFYTITANPASPSPFENSQTLGMLMNGASPIFDTVQTQENDTAVIIYTSGTTGQPKGAELSHSNLLMNAIMVRDMIEVVPEDVMLTVLPLFHIFGQSVQLNTGILTGSTNVLLPRFTPDDVFGLMLKEKVTFFAGVPTMYWALNHANINKEDIATISKNIRVAVSGGASLPVKVLKDFESKFDVPILEGYGMSEGSPVVTFNKLNRTRKPGSIGSAVWGVEVRLVDENDQPVPQGEKGEIIYRGHNVMKGYYNKPEANAKTLRNGWMHSGDIAVMDEDGDFFIVDRIKDMIIRGGLNVYPREVEDVLMKHPAVSLVAVIGVEDEEKGEEIKACIVLKEGQSATPEEIIAFAKAELAAYKYPRIIEIRSSLPMSATGKILKKILRQEAKDA